MNSLSIIIPALDEACHLPRLLTALTGGPGGAGPRVDAQILVVDGGSRDRTRLRAAAFAGVHVISAAPPRAAQMNLGALRATGDVLLFLHADTVPPAGFERCIARALRRAGVVGGAFSLRIDATGFRPWLISAGASLRSRITRSPYGDQGIFVRRSVFHALGGFRVQPFMEDLEFTHRLKRQGRVRLLPEQVSVSPRRWAARGYLRTTLENTVLAACFYLGVPPWRLKRWRSPVRAAPPAPAVFPDLRGVPGPSAGPTPETPASARRP